MASQGGKSKWKTVTYRKHSNTPPTPLPGATNSLIPFLSKPTYADALKTTSPPPQPPVTNRSPSPNPAEVPSPPTPTSAASYVSPHSPTGLRFPPSHHYPEWKGRCFHCCRVGHTAAQCKSPKRCGKCWGTGHVGTKCSSPLAPSPKPKPTPPTAPTMPKLNEPSFQDLLDAPAPTQPLPQGQPPRMDCFVDRDNQYYEEAEKLQGTVVMYNPDLEIDITIEDVALYAKRTGLVKAKDIAVGIMTRSRYAILLPYGVQV